MGISCLGMEAQLMSTLGAKISSSFVSSLDICHSIILCMLTYWIMLIHQLFCVLCIIFQDLPFLMSHVIHNIRVWVYRVHYDNRVRSEIVL